MVIFGFIVKKTPGMIIKSGSKGFPVGTVHTYNGKKFQKQSDGSWTQMRIGKKGPGSPEIKLDQKKALARGKKQSKLAFRHEEARKETVEIPEGFNKKKWSKKAFNKRLGELLVLKDVNRKPLGYKINKLNEKKLDKIKADIPTRNRFIMENKEFLFNEVHQIHRFFGERSDPVQSAYEGFILSINRSDPKRAKEFQQYARDYIRGYAMNKIKEDVQAKAHETSSNRPVSTKESSEGGKKIELEETLPGKATEIPNVEFRSTVSLMARKIKNKDAKKVLAYLVMGHDKKDTAKLMYGSDSVKNKMRVGRLVDRWIKPLAQKYLVKSVVFAKLLKQIMEF